MVRTRAHKCRISIAQNFKLTPLAGDAGGVAGLFQNRGDRGIAILQRAVRAVVTANGAVAHVPTSHQCAARGRTDGTRVRAMKLHALVGQ